MPTEYTAIRKASEALLKEKQGYKDAVEHSINKLDRELEETKAKVPPLLEEIAGLERLLQTAREVDPDFEEETKPAPRSSAPAKPKPKAKPKAVRAQRTPAASTIARNELKEKVVDFVRANPGSNGRAIARGVGIGEGPSAEKKISSLLSELKADTLHSKPAGKARAWFVNGESRSNGLETPPAPPSEPPGQLSDLQRKVLDAVIGGRGNPAKAPAEVAQLTNLPLVQVGPALEALTAQGYLQRGRPDSGPAVYAPGRRAAA